MKTKLQKRLQALEARKNALVEKGKSTEDVKELRSINADLESLNDEIAELRGMIEAIDATPAPAAAPVTEPVQESRSAAPVGRTQVLASYGVGQAQTANEGRSEVPEDAEKRGKELLEGRSVTVASSNIVLPAHSSDTINPTFNEVSSLIDRVNHKNLIGGESFKQPYVAGYGEGGYTAEGAAATTAETSFGYADINKAKVTAYAEDSEEIVKLPAADYDGEVQKGIRIASRKKLARQILIGTGATNTLAGIFSTAATAIDASTDLEIAEIDETTLDQIIYSYGGDEDVEDAAVLILNKKDLKAFAALRTADGKKIHDIKSKGNVGTIDTVPFLINSACKGISVSTDASGSYCMAYGPLSNYTLVTFSDLEISRSTDYKFKEGMVAHRGVVFAGGNVTSKNGFLRIKKA